MAFFDRTSSAPSLVNAEDFQMVIRTFSSEMSDEDSIASEPYHYGTKAHRRSDACSQSLSESEQSPVIIRKDWHKKRRAPPPPGPPPPYPSPGSLRHSYAFENSNRASSDTESLSLSASFRSPRLVYQTSTDSDNPSDLAGSASFSSNLLTPPDLEQSGSGGGHTRDRSRLWMLKNALRSPSILRKNSKREDRDESETKPSRTRKQALTEPPEFPGLALALIQDDVLEADTEFEVSEHCLDRTQHGSTLTCSLNGSALPGLRLEFGE